MTQPQLSRILEAAVYSGDLDAAEAFYGGVLGLARISRVGDRHVFYRLGGGVVLVFNPEHTEAPPTNPALPVPPHGARGPGHLCLAAERAELDTWRAHLLATGITIEADFEWPHGARSIYFRDPAGNSIEIAEPALWFSP